MEEDAYLRMAREQETHWWFRARREILSSEINKLNLKEDAQILEIGCGPGGNLNMLKRYGRVDAMEMDNFSRQYASNLTGLDILSGALPHDIGNIKTKYDLICLFDVLEHIENDNSALATIQQLLQSNGVVLITVPAYEWLYSAHDKFHHHFRRYSKATLIQKARTNNFMVNQINYFNFLLFPLLLTIRMCNQFFQQSKPIGNELPPAIVNYMLYQIFRLEKYVIRYVNFPFGLSILAVLSYQKH